MNTVVRYEQPHVDHLVLNEAELTLPMILRDLERGCAQHLYATDQWADITAAWDRADIQKENTMYLPHEDPRRPEFL